MTTGAVTLRDIRNRGLIMPDVACSKCDRAGRLSVERLIGEHGLEMGLPQLRGIIAHDCPKMTDALVAFDRCGVHFPQLEEGG